MLIENCIYGVDIQPIAIQICRVCKNCLWLYGLAPPFLDYKSPVDFQTALVKGRNRNSYEYKNCTTDPYSGKITLVFFHFIALQREPWSASEKGKLCSATKLLNNVSDNITLDDFLSLTKLVILLVFEDELELRNGFFREEEVFVWALYKYTIKTQEICLQISAVLGERVYVVKKKRYW
jgi:hypothetical protein